MVADDPLDCAPRQKPMTREDIEAHVHKIIDGYFDEGGGWAASSGLMETLNVLAEHDAAQRETIARLEGELQEEQELTTWWGNLVRREQIGTKKTPSLRAYIEQLEARLTASEARVKQQGDVLAYLLDCGPEIVRAVQEAKSDVSEDYGEEQRQERDALGEQVKALQQARRWTREKPTKADTWWWVRFTDNRWVDTEGPEEWCIVQVWEEDGRMVCSIMESEPLSELNYGFTEWSGPIEAPKEG